MEIGEGGWLEREVTGGGPTLAKLRAAERSGAARAPLIRTLRLWPLETVPTIPDPPLNLKVERRGGGSGMVSIAVDPGALIWTVGEMRP